MCPDIGMVHGWYDLVIVSRFFSLFTFFVLGHRIPSSTFCFCLLYIQYLMWFLYLCETVRDVLYTWTIIVSRNKEREKMVWLNGHTKIVNKLASDRDGDSKVIQSERTNDVRGEIILLFVFLLLIQYECALARTHKLFLFFHIFSHFLDVFYWRS